MPVTRLRRSAAPRSGGRCEAKRKQKTRGRQRAAGVKKKTLFDIVKKEKMRAGRSDEAKAKSE
jgi:hypothetical protein